MKIPTRPNYSGGFKQERKLNMYELPTIAGRNGEIDATPLNWYKKSNVGGPDMETEPKGLSAPGKVSLGNVHGSLYPAVTNVRRRGFSF